MIDKLSYMWVCVCVKDSLNEDKLSTRKYTNINHSILLIGKTLIYTSKDPNKRLSKYISSFIYEFTIMEHNKQTICLKKTIFLVSHPFLFHLRGGHTFSELACFKL